MTCGLPGVVMDGVRILALVVPQGHAYTRRGRGESLQRHSERYREEKENAEKPARHGVDFTRNSLTCMPPRGSAARLISWASDKTFDGDSKATA